MKNNPCTAEEIHITMGVLCKYGTWIQILEAFESASNTSHKPLRLVRKDWEDLVPISQNMHPHLDYSWVRTEVVQRIFRRALRLMDKYKIYNKSDIGGLMTAMQEAVRKWGKAWKKATDTLLLLAPYYEAVKK